MNRILAAGLLVTLVGVVGYTVGLWVVYPGRAFSVTVAMVGITLTAIGSGRPRDDHPFLSGPGRGGRR